MVHWEREVRSLLRPSGHLHLLLVGTALPNNLATAHIPHTRGPSVILAVVGHMPVGRAVEDSGRSMLYIYVLIFRAELVVKVCSYTEYPSAVQAHQLSMVPSHSNIYSQFMETSLSKYLNILRYHPRA